MRSADELGQLLALLFKRLFLHAQLVQVLREVGANLGHAVRMDLELLHERVGSLEDVLLEVTRDQQLGTDGLAGDVCQLRKSGLDVFGILDTDDIFAKTATALP